MGLAAMSLGWWMYPMKPVPMGVDGVSRIRMDDYLLERKYDGWRAILTVHGRPRLWTRQRRPIGVPDELMDAISSLNLPPGTVLDGEVWNPSKRGGWTDPEGDGCRLTLWDCIRDGMKDVGTEPLETRRKALEDLVGGGTGPVGLTSPIDAAMEEVEAVEAEARASRDGRSGFIHGVVLKRRGSRRHDHPNRSTESADWLKVVFPGMKGWEPRSRT